MVCATALKVCFLEGVGLPPSPVVLKRGARPGPETGRLRLLGKGSPEAHRPPEQVTRLEHNTKPCVAPRTTEVVPGAADGGKGKRIEKSQCSMQLGGLRSKTAVPRSSAGGGHARTGQRAARSGQGAGEKICQGASPGSQLSQGIRGLTAHEHEHAAGPIDIDSASRRVHCHWSLLAATSSR